MKTIDQIEPAGLISPRLLAPTTVLGPTAAAALINGPKVLAFFVDPVCTQVATYAAMKQKGMDHANAQKVLMEMRSKEIAQDAQVLFTRTQPIMILWELQPDQYTPYMLWSDGVSLPITPTMAATMNMLHKVPMAVDAEDFEAEAVPVGEDRPWCAKDLHTYYARIAATRIQGFEFDTSLPPHIEAFLGSFDGPAKEGKTE